MRLTFSIIAALFALALGLLSFGIITAPDEPVPPGALYDPDIKNWEHPLSGHDYSIPTYADIRNLNHRVARGEKHAAHALIEIYTNKKDTNIVLEGLFPQVKQALLAYRRETSSRDYEDLVSLLQKRCELGQLSAELCIALLPQIVCFCGPIPPLLKSTTTPLKEIRQQSRRQSTQTE